MIDTVEIAPHIFAKYLAEHLKTWADDYISVDKYAEELKAYVDEDALQKRILKYCLKQF